MKVLEKGYVFVVMEHAVVGENGWRGKDAAVHGVYTTREIALNKEWSLRSKNQAEAKTTGYITVRKMPIQGPDLNKETLVFRGK